MPNSGEELNKGYSKMKISQSTTMFGAFSPPFFTRYPFGKSSNHSCWCEQSGINFKKRKWENPVCVGDISLVHFSPLHSIAPRVDDIVGIGLVQWDCCLQEGVELSSIARSWFSYFF